MKHHHNEILEHFNQHEFNDEVEDAEKLDILLQTKYPHLDFVIIVIFACKHMFL